MHLLHPVSHIGHHVVEHAERIPHHVLHKYKRQKKHNQIRAVRVERAWLEFHTVTRPYQPINNSIMCISIHARIQ